MKPTLLLAALLALSTPAWSGDDHSKHHGPLHGGVVVANAGLDWELVAKPERIVLRARNHGKEIASAGASGKLTLLVGKERSEVALKPAGTDRLEADGPFKLAPGTKVVATVTLAGKKPANLRFTLP